MERSERDNQLQDIIHQHCGVSTTGRRFEWVIFLVWQNIPHPPWTPPATPLSPTPAIQISEDEVRQVFRKQKRKKAQGTDCVTPVCLKSCADQLAPIFTKIFNRSLELCEVPSLQTLHHHPYPKEIQNCRTKLLQACGFSICGHEVIWKTAAGPPEGHHWTLAGSSSVCIQSKKVCGRCSKHWTALCTATSRQTYVRILFVDFSSALNTIIPNLLLPKLTQLSVPTSVGQWINSFLTDMQQVVRLGKYTFSTPRTISTGAPQGCVLSPLLISLYTNDCTSRDSSVKLLKFADDTTSASSRMVTSLLTDRRLRSWLSGAVLTTWSWTRSKQ